MQSGIVLICVQINIVCAWKHETFKEISHINIKKIQYANAVQRRHQEYKDLHNPRRRVQFRPVIMKFLQDEVSLLSLTTLTSVFLASDLKLPLKDEFSVCYLISVMGIIVESVIFMVIEYQGEVYLMGLTTLMMSSILASIYNLQDAVRIFCLFLLVFHVILTVSLIILTILAILSTLRSVLRSVLRIVPGGMS